MAMSSKIILDDECKFNHPSSIILSGASMSGKTAFTFKLIDNIGELFNPVPAKIIVSYGENQQQYKNCHKEITFVEGLDFDTTNDSNAPTLIIIDDQMTESASHSKIQDLFTKGVHHRNQSVLYITQNLFHQGRFSRDIRLNTHYFIVFKSPSFVSQIMHFGRQIWPEKPKFLISAYKKATENPFSYLFINLHPKCNDNLRVRSCILPGEDEIVFIPQ